MSQLITVTDISTIRPVFSQGASENIKRYNQLKKLFEKNKEYQVFAEPVPAGGQKIAWHTDFKGRAIPYEKLSKSEQETAKGRLKNQVNRLYQGVVKVVKGSNKGTKELFDLIDSFIEIPDYKDIYVIKNPNGQTNFCIIRWGFTTDNFKAQTGLVEKLIPLKVDTVVIKAELPDSSPAASEKIMLETGNETFEATTDFEGKIYLEDVPIFGKIDAYQINKEEEKIYEHNYINDHNDEYLFQIGELEIPPVMQNTIIKTVAKSGAKLANITMFVKFGESEGEIKSNENGEIKLGELEVGTEIQCWQIIDNNRSKTTKYVVSENMEFYNFNAKKPITSGKMNIKLIDEKGNPIPESKVKIFYDGKTEEFKTDKNGNILINNVEFKTEIKCQQVVDNIAKHQTSFVFEKNKKDYIMTGSVPRPVARYANITIQVVNRQDEVIPNLKVVVDNGKKTSNLISNQDGEIFLSQINCSHQIIVKTEYQKKKTEKLFYCKDDNEFHKIVLGRKKGLFWLWLIPLILLFLAALFYFFLLPFILDDKEDIIPIVDTILVVDTTHVIDTIPEVVEEQKGINIVVLDKKTNQPVENASVTLEYNDQKIERETDAKGIINFADVPEEKIQISITINAQSYTEQIATFMFTKEKTFYMSDKSVDVSEIEIPCGQTINSKGYGSTIKTVRVNKTSGTVRIIFDTFSIADEVIIYNGKSSEINDNKIAWKSKGYVRSRHRENFQINSPDSLITIQINGGDEKRTEWYFKVYCN